MPVAVRWCGGGGRKDEVAVCCLRLVCKVDGGVAGRRRGAGRVSRGRNCRRGSRRRSAAGEECKQSLQRQPLAKGQDRSLMVLKRHGRAVTTCQTRSSSREGASPDSAPRNRLECFRRAYNRPHTARTQERSSSHVQVLMLAKTLSSFELVCLLLAAPLIRQRSCQAACLRVSYLSLTPSLSATSSMRFVGGNLNRQKPNRTC